MTTQRQGGYDNDRLWLIVPDAIENRTALTRRCCDRTTAALAACRTALPSATDGHAELPLLTMIIAPLSDTSKHAAVSSTHACAKINLTLEVLGRRADGYHELRSLAIGVDLRDRIACRTQAQAGATIRCSARELENSDNLAVRAAEALARELGRDPAVHITLEKAIPVAAGLGGGSSDAAATLRLCNDLWRSALGPARLAAVGAQVGSDVPLFFSMPAAMMEGRGERVERVALRWTGWVLLVFVKARVSTEEVYRQWRPSDGAPAPDGADAAIVQAQSAAEVSRFLFNHLEPAVFRVCPTVARVARALDRSPHGPMRVCGAGSTLYRLFDEEEAARRAAADVASMQWNVATAVVAAPVAPGPIVSEEC